VQANVQNLDLLPVMNQVYLQFLLKTEVIKLSMLASKNKNYEEKFLI